MCHQTGTQLSQRRPAIIKETKRDSHSRRVPKAVAIVVIVARGVEDPAGHRERAQGPGRPQRLRVAGVSEAAVVIETQQQHLQQRQQARKEERWRRPAAVRRVPPRCVSEPAIKE